MDGEETADDYGKATGAIWERGICRRPIAGDVRVSKPGDVEGPRASAGEHQALIGGSDRADVGRQYSGARGLFCELMVGESRARCCVDGPRIRPH
jgi:hypothetical protein